MESTELLIEFFGMNIPARRKRMTTDETLSLSDSKLLKFKVAVLASQGLRQKHIIERLGFKQPTISKKYKEALDEGLIEVPPPVWRGSARVYREVDRLLHPLDDLHESLCGLSREAERLLEVRILENPLDALSRGEGKGRNEFARRVAEYLLEERLPRDGVVGAAWGGTLLDVARAVEAHLKRPPEGWEELFFVPICGDPPEVDRWPHRSAASIAASLETALTGRTEFEHSFSSVSGCIPEGFSGDRAETIRAFFRTFPGYRAVFGAGRSDRGALIKELEGMLTSIATNEASSEADITWLDAASTAAGVSAEDLAGASVGNIGGLFVEHRDASAADRRLVERVNSRWTGFRFDHMERCARAAASDPERLGVVVIAGRHASQAPTALECVRRGYVNRLLLDPRVAGALEKLL